MKIYRVCFIDWENSGRECYLKTYDNKEAALTHCMTFLDIHCSESYLDKEHITEHERYCDRRDIVYWEDCGTEILRLYEEEVFVNFEELP